MPTETVQLQANRLSQKIEVKMNSEYGLLLFEMADWEAQYAQKHFFNVNEKMRDKKGLVFIDGKPYWDQMEKARVKRFGQKANELFLMRLFSDENKVLQAAKTDLASHVKIF